MIKDKLIEIQNVKADLKAALTQHGLNPGDEFETYADLIRSLKN